MSNKPTLVYYSPDCFSQVDDTVLHHLTNDFHVVWLYLYDSLQSKSMRYNPEKAKEYADNYGILLEVLDPKMRRRNPKNILFYREVAQKINDYNPDIVYACEMFPFWLLTYRYIKCKNKVYGIHDVLPHYEKASFIKRWILKKKEQYIKVRFDYIVTFSRNQHDILKERFGKESSMVGMSYKYFGKPTEELYPINEGVRLLFFGIINHYKGLDLLIKAIEDLRREGINNLSLTIAGKGADWEECKAYIKTPEMYNLKVRFIDNSEIPNLMNTHHFLVLPYRTATQSGPLVTALGYGLPVIAPLFGCFKDTLNDDSAVFYQQGELARALRRVSSMPHEEYSQMRQAMNDIRELYSEERIGENYVAAFKKALGE